MCSLSELKERSSRCPVTETAVQTDGCELPCSKAGEPGGKTHSLIRHVFDIHFCLLSKAIKYFFHDSFLTFLIEMSSPSDGEPQKHASEVLPLACDVLDLKDNELMQEQIKHLTSLRDNLEACVAHKDVLIAQLESEYHILMEENRMHMDAVDKCNSQLRSLEDKISQHFYEGDDHEGDDGMPLVECFVSRVAGLVKQYELLLDNHTSHTMTCTEHLNTLNSTLILLNEKVADYEMVVVSLNSEANARSCRINGLEETISELNLASKEKEMMETVMQEEIRQRNQEMSMLEEGYTSLEQKVAEAEQRAAAIVEERQRWESAEKRVQELKMALQEAEVLQHFLQKEVMAREQEISSGNASVKKLGSELEAARHMSLELQGEAEAQLNQVLALKASLAVKDYDIDEKEEAILTLKEEIESQQEIVNGLQEMLLSNKAARTELSLELEHRTTVCTKLEETVQEMTAELAVQTEGLSRWEREKEVEITCLKDMHVAALQGLKGNKIIILSN